MTLSERDFEQIDPMRLDREVSRAAREVRRYLRAQRGGEFGGSGGMDPFLFTRAISGRTAYNAITDLPAYDPLRGPLLRWVYALAQERINGAARERLATERYRTEHKVSSPEHTRASLSVLLRRGLDEPGRRDAWFAAYASVSEGLGEAVAIFYERRAEVAVRLGLAGSDVHEGVGADVYAAAEQLLAATDDAFAEVHPGSLGGLVTLGLGAEARDAFPRLLLPRTLLDFFRETDLFRSVDLDPGELPEPIAPSSFMRALSRVGAAWSDATAPQDQPFVIAHDPFGLRRRTLGALFGALPATPVFARRALSLDPGRLRDFERVMGRIVLLEARVLAMRVLLRKPAFEGKRSLQQAFEGLSLRALGVPILPRAAGAVFQLRPDDVQRLAGFLLAFGLADSMRERYDEDWYRNPRAAEQLRDEARLSPETQTTDDALARGASAFTRRIA